MYKTPARSDGQGFCFFGMDFQTMKQSGKPQNYVGIDKDINGGMTPIGKVIRDAWVFELLSESETCENWSYAEVDALQDKVNAQWDKYGCLVRNLPDDIRQRHERIHNEAIEKARQVGWAGEDETRDDH